MVETTEGMLIACDCYGHVLKMQDENGRLFVDDIRRLDPTLVREARRLEMDCAKTKACGTRRARRLLVSAASTQTREFT